MAYGAALDGYGGVAIDVGTGVVVVGSGVGVISSTVTASKYLIDMTAFDDDIGIHVQYRWCCRTEVCGVTATIDILYGVLVAVVDGHLCGFA